MHEAVSPFGHALLEALRELPGGGGADTIEHDARAHASRALPVVTVFGAYDSGKSSLIKRLLVDDGREVPPWLTVSARRETFEVRECEAFGCVLRDTPGISGGNAAHERMALDALALSDVIVITVPSQLLTSERDAVLDILFGRQFAEGGISFPPSCLHIVVTRLDEAGIDPEDDSDGHARLMERKFAELRGMLVRGGIDPGAIGIHAVCPDPFARAARVRQPPNSMFDGSRSWDGVAPFRDVLSGLGRTLPVLRAGAAERYFALAAMRARASVDDEVECQQLALDTCRSDLERLSLLDTQLDALSASARASLESLVEEEIQSAARLHGLSQADVTREAASALARALGRWREQNDATILKLARDAGEELAARKGSAGRRSLADVLGHPSDGRGDGSVDSGKSGFVEGVRRFGPRLADAVRALHEVHLGMSLETARRELARVDALGSFENYVKAAGRSRIFRDVEDVTNVDSAVRLQGTIAAVGPLLIELATFYAEQQHQRRAATERAQRLEELRVRVGAAANKIAADEWQDWEKLVTAFRTGLDDRRDTPVRLEGSLVASVNQLEHVRGRLVGMIAQGTGSGAQVISSAPPPPAPHAPAASPSVNSIALEGEGEAAGVEADERGAMAPRAAHTTPAGCPPRSTAAMTTPHGPPDLGVVVALPEELRELLDLVGPYTAHHDADLDTYLFERGPYRCAVSLVGDMGEAQATRVTERIIAVWDPGSIVVVGVTGSVHDDLRIGDVHVPPQAVQYIQDAKATSTPAGGFAVVPGAPAYHADYALLAAVRRFEFSQRDAYQRWITECAGDLAVLVPDRAHRERLLAENLVRPDVRLLADGHVATGPMVGAAAAFSAWIRTHDRNVKSLEMESAAVLLAAQTRHDPKRALAIRGISDYGDDRKQALDQSGGGALRRYAMRNAVRLLLALLDAEALPRENTTQSP